MAMTPLWTGVTLWVCITLTMAPPVTAEVEDASVTVEDDEMDLEEDLTTFTKEGDTMYKALWRPRDCTGPAEEGDNVTMLMSVYQHLVDPLTVRLRIHNILAKQKQESCLFFLP